MEILFIILKIIGILLAVLLLLCIIIILVPIRYRIDIKAQEEIEGKAVIHWLFHLLDVRLYYRDRDISLKLRIFGIAVPLDRGKKKSRADKPASQELEEDPARLEGPKPEEMPDGSNRPKPEEMSDGSNSSKPEEMPDGLNSSKPEEMPEGSDIREPAPLDNSKPERSDSPEWKAGQGKQEIQKLGDKTASEKKRRRKYKRKPGIIQRIKLSFNNFGKKMRGTANGIRQRLSDIRNGTTTVKEQIENIKSMILEETNQNAFLHALQVIRYLLRHYLPGKVTGTLNFSMGSPDQTGKALGAMGMLPFWVRSKMVVMPDFVSESFYIKAILFATGRVRFLHLLISGIRLITDRNVRKLITNIRG